MCKELLVSRPHLLFANCSDIKASWQMGSGVRRWLLEKRTARERLRRGRFLTGCKGIGLPFQW
jgi:hypothetical protein